MQFLIDIVYAGALSVVVIGVYQAIKMAFNFPDRVKPILSVGLAIGLAMLYQLITGQVFYATIFEAIVAGLIACGLYDQKAITK